MNWFLILCSANLLSFITQNLIVSHVTFLDPFNNSVSIFKILIQYILYILHTKWSVKEFETHPDFSEIKESLYCHKTRVIILVHRATLPSFYREHSTPVTFTLSARCWRRVEFCRWGCYHKRRICPDFIPKNITQSLLQSLHWTEDFHLRVNNVSYITNTEIYPVIKFRVSYKRYSGIRHFVVWLIDTHQPGYYSLHDVTSQETIILI